MTNLERVIVDIESLSSDEFARLRNWLLERDWDRWERELEKDVIQKKLDFLKKEVKEEKESENLRSL